MHTELSMRLVKILRLPLSYQSRLTCVGRIGGARVAHVASIIASDLEPNEAIPGVVAGALNAVYATSEKSSSKHFLYTSSSTVITPSRPIIELGVSTEDCHSEAIEVAWKPPPYEFKRAWAVYTPNKSEAGHALWGFLKRRDRALSQPGIAIFELRPTFLDPATSIDWGVN